LLRSGPYAVSLADVEAAPSGLDFGPPAEGRLPERLRTPDKTVACADPECLEALAALEVPETSAGHDGALLLIGRRHLRTNNSWLANSRRMTKGPNRCTLMIHPDDATARGIADGETATVRSRAGSIALPAEVTEDIMPGTVSIPHGWGHGLPGIAMQTAKPTPASA
jgi:anaerobic selenocysteine-containing dehydrogenase